MTRTTLRDAIADPDELDRFRDLYAGLSAELDPTLVALAAIKLAHDASGSSLDEVEIPDLAARVERPRPSGPTAGKFGAGAGAGAAGKYGAGKTGPGGKPVKGQWSERARTAAADRTGRIYVGVGRSSGALPGDLVGAIANETALSGGDIGAIRVSDHYSVVEIPESSIDDVIAAMKKTTIRGKQAKVRRFTD